MDNFNEEKSIPYCQLLAEMSRRRKKITSIKHRITLKGSKQQGDFILINLPQGGECTVYVHVVSELHCIITCTAGSPTTERDQTFGDLAAAAIGNVCLNASTVLLNIPRLPNNIHAIAILYRSWSSSY